ncbi:hypothetical protein GCM10011428_20530 [Streptomyces violaceus]
MTSTFPNVSINTERLVLRPLDEDDVAALAAMMNDEQVAAWTSVPQPFTEDGARTWITEYAPTERTEGRGLDFAVTEFLTQRLVGVIQLGKTNWHVRSTELSYIIAPWARGEGYASEAALVTAGGSSRTRNSNASNCARRPTTPPPSRSPRRSAVSARACCATPV